jgi:hypothetical protein
MKSVYYVLTALLLVGLAVPFSVAQNEAQRPNGAAREMWVSLGDGVGLVVGSRRVDPHAGASSYPKVSGLLMIKRGQEWHEVELGPGAHAQRVR